MPETFSLVRRNAFTLIELIVVIVIIGLLTAMASLSLSGVMDQYQLSRAAEMIEMLDGKTRREARFSREPFEAVIRPAMNEVVVSKLSQLSNRSETTKRLPGNVNVLGVKMQRTNFTGRDVRVPYSKQGRSPTYAIELQRGNMTRWLIVLGFSGQVIAVNSEEEVDALLL